MYMLFLLSLNLLWLRNFRDAFGVEIAMRYLVLCRIEECVVVLFVDVCCVLVILSILCNVVSEDDLSVLSDDEIYEFYFRRAWLRFMWARVREVGMDVGVVDECEEYWLLEM